MSKEIDFITLDKDNPVYMYSLEAIDDRNRECGGCRTRNKEDLRLMYQIWKETYGAFNLKYIFKKGGSVISLN